MSLEIDRDRAKTSVSERRHIAAKAVNATSPAVHQLDWRRRRIAPLNHPNFYSGAKTRKSHAIGRIARRKHLAGPEITPATESDHQINSISLPRSFPMRPMRQV